MTNAKLLDLKPLLELQAEFDRQLAALAADDNSGVEALLAEYVALNEYCNALTKIKNAANDQIRILMGESKSLEAGQYLAALMPSKRSDLDRKALTAEMGQDFVTRFTKVTEYESLKVRKV